MAAILHITADELWKLARQKGYYETPSLKDEGFIHCCLPGQVQDVLRRYFEGKTNLVTLEIETEKLTSPFYYEWSPSTADTFPHIYGPVNLDAVGSVKPISETAQ